MTSTLEGTTSSLTENITTITEANANAATQESQEAIKVLLLRILTKTTAALEALRVGQRH